MDYPRFSDIHDTLFPLTSLTSIDVTNGPCPVSEATLDGLISYGQGDKSAILEVRDFLLQQEKSELATLKTISIEEATI